MEYAMFILTAVGTVATIISTVIAVKAKNQARSVLKRIESISNSGPLIVANYGSNSGLMSGQSTGDIHNNK